MRNILLAIIAVVLPASVALAEQPGKLKLDKPATPEKLLPLKSAGSGNSCAAFGPGFAKVDGTDTCVKVGGAVQIGTRSSIGSR
jgi:hypothetical protein